MRSAAGLHRGNLLRLSEVADVEDADAAETLRADWRRDALRPAIDSTESLLHGHEEQVAVDGHVALPPGTHDRHFETRFAYVLDVVRVEPVVVAEPEIVPLKREIGVREAQEERRLSRRPRAQERHGCLIRIVHGSRGISFRRDGVAGWRFRVEESLRLGKARDELHAAGRLPGVPQAGLESNTWVRRRHRAG